MALYVQDENYVNSDILDDYGLITYARTYLNKQDINSVNEAIELLAKSSEIDSRKLDEKWTLLENSERINQQAERITASRSSLAFEKYLESNGLQPNVAFIGDFVWNIRDKFGMVNVQNVVDFYGMTKAHSLEDCVDTWINNNYVDAVERITDWSQIIDIAVSTAIEKIIQELPNVDSSKLRTYLVSNIQEVQKEYPHYQQIIEKLKTDNRNESESTFTIEEVNDVIYNDIRSEYFKYWNWDDEHFQTITGMSVQNYAQKLANEYVADGILDGEDKLPKQQIELSVAEDMEDVEERINLLYCKEIDDEYEKYAREHSKDEYSLSIAEDVAAYQSQKLVAWAKDIEMFIEDNGLEPLDHKDIEEEIVSALGGFNLAFLTPYAEFENIDEFIEQLHHYDSMDEFIEDLDEELICSIDMVEDEFSEWLVDHKDDYSNLTPNEAYQEFIENPDWNLYLTFIKSEYSDFNSLVQLVQAVGFTNEFYYSPQEAAIAYQEYMKH